MREAFTVANVSCCERAQGAARDQLSQAFAIGCYEWMLAMESLHYNNHVPTHHVVKAAMQSPAELRYLGAGCWLKSQPMSPHTAAVMGCRKEMAEVAAAAAAAVCSRVGLWCASVRAQAEGCPPTLVFIRLHQGMVHCRLSPPLGDGDAAAECACPGRWACLAVRWCRHHVAVGTHAREVAPCIS